MSKEVKTHMEIWTAKIPYDGKIWNAVGDNELEELIGALEETFEEWKRKVLGE